MSGQERWTRGLVHVVLAMRCRGCGYGLAGACGWDEAMPGVTLAWEVMKRARLGPNTFIIHCRGGWRLLQLTGPVRRQWTNEEQGGLSAIRTGLATVNGFSNGLPS